MTSLNVAQQPRTLPDPGQILDLQAGDVRYRSAPPRFRVQRVREDISRWYDGAWVWLEGHELHPTAGHPMLWLQILVAVDAIERHRQDTGTTHRGRHTGRASVAP